MFIDRFLAFFNLQKIAQTKPSDYPVRNKIPINTLDRDKLLNPVQNDTNNIYTQVAVPGAPENLSKNVQPQTFNPQDGGAVSNAPFNNGQEINPTGGQSTEQKTDISGKPINPNWQLKDIDELTNESRAVAQLRPVMDIDEIESINHAIAQRMRTVGIRVVDKEIFMNTYNNCIKKAVLKRVPLSQLLDEEWKI